MIRLFVLICALSWFAQAEKPEDYSPPLYYKVTGLGFPLSDSKRIPWDKMYKNTTSIDYINLVDRICPYLNTKYSEYAKIGQCPDIAFEEYGGHVLASYTYRLKQNITLNLAALQGATFTLAQKQARENSSIFEKMFHKLVRIHENDFKTPSNFYFPDLQFIATGVANVKWEKPLTDQSSPAYDKASFAICQDIKLKFKGVLLTEECPHVVFWNKGNAVNFDAYVEYRPWDYSVESTFTKLSDSINKLNELLRAKQPSVKTKFDDAMINLYPRINRPVVFKIMGLGFPKNNSKPIPWDRQFADKGSVKYEEVMDITCSYLFDKFKEYVTDAECPQATFHEENQMTIASYFYTVKFMDMKTFALFRDNVQKIFATMTKDDSHAFQNKARWAIAIHDYDVVLTTTTPEPILELAIYGKTKKPWNNALLIPTSREYHELRSLICCDLEKTFKDVFLDNQCPTMVFYRDGPFAAYDAYVTYDPQVYIKSPKYVNPQHYWDSIEKAVKSQDDKHETKADGSLFTYVPGNEPALVYKIMGWGYPLSNSKKMPWSPKYGDPTKVEHKQLADTICAYVEGKFTNFVPSGRCPAITIRESNGFVLASYQYLIRDNKGLDAVKFRAEISKIFRTMQSDSSKVLQNSAKMVLSLYDDALVEPTDMFTPNLDLGFIGNVRQEWNDTLLLRNTTDYQEMKQKVCEYLQSTFSNVLLSNECPSVVFWKFENIPYFDVYMSHTPSVYTNSTKYGNLGSYSGKMYQDMMDQKFNWPMKVADVIISFAPMSQAPVVHNIMGLGFALDRTGQRKRWDSKLTDTKSKEYEDLVEIVCPYLYNSFRKYVKAGRCPHISFIESDGYAFASYNYEVVLGTNVDPYVFRKQISKIFEDMTHDKDTNIEIRDRFLLSKFYRAPLKQENPTVPSMELAISGSSRQVWSPSLMDPYSPKYESMSRTVCNDIKTTLKHLLFTDTCPHVVFRKGGSFVSFDASVVFMPSKYASSPHYKNYKNYITAIMRAMQTVKAKLTFRSEVATVSYAQDYEPNFGYQVMGFGYPLRSAFPIPWNPDYEDRNSRRYRELVNLICPYFNLRFQEFMEQQDCRTLVFKRDNGVALATYYFFIRLNTAVIPNVIRAKMERMLTAMGQNSGSVFIQRESLFISLFKTAIVKPTNPKIPNLQINMYGRVNATWNHDWVDQSSKQYQNISEYVCKDLKVIFSNVFGSNSQCPTFRFWRYGSEPSFDAYLSYNPSQYITAPDYGNVVKYIAKINDDLRGQKQNLTRVVDAIANFAPENREY